MNMQETETPNWKLQTLPQPSKPIGWRGAIVALRLIFIALLLVTLLPMFFLLRLLEFRQGRTLSSRVVQFALRNSLRVAGIGLCVFGQPAAAPAALVCNHASWLDIIAVGAAHRVTFVARAEVGRWFLIAPLARIVGTIFIERNSLAARQHIGSLSAQIAIGRVVAVFPEGTSTDGLRVLPFKPTLFQSFFDIDADRHLKVQPVTIRYHAPPGEDPRFYGWWGTMDLVPHIMRCLSSTHGGRVNLTFHEPLDPVDFADRKELAAKCEAIIRDKFHASH